MGACVMKDLIGKRDGDNTRSLGDNRSLGSGGLVVECVDVGGLGDGNAMVGIHAAL